MVPLNPDRVPAFSPERLQAQQRSASFGSSETSNLNKDSQTEIFSLVSAVSNPKEPKTSTNLCYPLRVREELHTSVGFV